VREAGQGSLLAERGILARELADIGEAFSIRVGEDVREQRIGG